MNDYTKRIIRGGEYTPDDCKYPMLWVQMHKILAFHLCEFCSAETYEDFAHNTDAILSLPKEERAVKERYARHVRASFDVLRTYRQQQGC